MYKTVHGTLPWHDRQEWLFPEMDKRLSKSFVFGPKDVDDAMLWIDVLCVQYRTCIQAGGAMGIWPIRLAQFFDRVVTLEAHPVNYTCLLNNTQDIENIEPIHAALGRESGRVSMCLNKNEKENAGAHYVWTEHATNRILGDEVEQRTIDSLGCTDVDLIYLDIEGAETDALLGATETIAKCRPVIGLEDRRSQHYWRFGYKQGPSKMLIKDFGYKRIASYHLDVILAPSEQQPVGNDIEIVTIPPKENT